MSGILSHLQRTLELIFGLNNWKSGDTRQRHIIFNGHVTSHWSVLYYLVMWLISCSLENASYMDRIVRNGVPKSSWTTLHGSTLLVLYFMSSEHWKPTSRRSLIGCPEMAPCAYVSPLLLRQLLQCRDCVFTSLSSWSEMEQMLKVCLLKHLNHWIKKV